jgi:two-component system LytT family response regulator
MIKAIIVEDESIHMEHLKQQLKAVCPEVNVVAEFSSAQQAIRDMTGLTFDLLFLDVELGNTTAFELLQKISYPHNYHIIFTSAFNHYAIQAFKVNATDYLLKPIDGKELRLAVSKAMKQIFTTEAKESLLTDYYFTKDQHIVIIEKKCYNFIPIHLIIYCQSDGNYTDIFYIDDYSDEDEHEHNGSSKLQVTSSKNISYFEKILVPKGFVRIHRSYLVNKSKIRKIDHRDCKVVLQGNIQLTISRSQWDIVLHELTK